MPTAPASARIPALVPVTLVASEPAVSHPVWTRRFGSEPFDFVLLVGSEVALEPEPLGLVVVVALPRQDVSARPVEEPAVVGNHHRAAGELLQRVLQRAQRLDVEVVGWLVEQDQVSALFERERQIEPVAFTTGQHTDRLLLVGT